MALAPEVDLHTLIADKVALRRLLEQQDSVTGFVPDADATPQKARAMMLEEGLRPEDNLFSREIIWMREEG